MLVFTYILLFISLYFEVFLLVSFLENRMQHSRSRTRRLVQLPSVAIVVPCYNEQNGLRGTLQSLLQLSYPPQKLEILVVDDGSTDNTLSIAQQFATDPRVKIFSKQNGGKHTAMNMALAHTSAEFIGCLDADSVVDTQALAHIIPVFENERVAAVTPGIFVKETSNALQHMQHVEYQISVFNRFILALIGSTFITPGPFSIFRASVLRSLGGWRHAHSTEDMELALRMQEAGHLIANAPRAKVYTSTPQTIQALYKQRVRWTYGFLRNAFDYRHIIGSRKYGNLGILVMPSTVAAVAIGIFFFLRLIWQTAQDMLQAYAKITVTHSVPSFHFSVFYIDTSAMWFLVWLSVAIIVALVSAGSWIGTGSRRPPLATPLFLFVYCFLAPTWLVTALVRATLKTGVQWR